MSLVTKVLSGTVWASVDRFGTTFLQFFVNLVLARLLTPADYGCIGMLAIFLVVSQVLIDGGFGSALIQKSNRHRWTIPQFSFGIYFCLFPLCSVVLFCAPDSFVF